MQKAARAALAIALCSFGCSENPAAPLPTSPTSLERPASAGSPIPPASTNSPGLAAESDVVMELVPADGAPLADFSDDFESVVEATVEVDGAPDSPAPIFDVPGKPTLVNVSVDGMEITMTWGPAPNGKAGPPTRYLVYCNCTGKIEALPSTARAKTWTATKAGTYTLFVLAGNSKGSGPTVNKTVVVNSDAGTFKGAAASGIGWFKRVFSGGSCTWRVTFTVTPTITMKSGPSGTLRMEGGYSAPSPRTPCLAASGTFGMTKPLVFAATTFSSTHTINVADMKFVGSLLKGVITGKVTITYRYGTGQIVIPLTLKKT